MIENKQNPPNWIRFTIDGQSICVKQGTTVYAAAKQYGIDIPIFCYHDRMPPFGACRVCLVEVESMSKLQTACTLQASEGMIIRTQSHMAIEGRKSILEFLLINHPLDCPICDKAGECPLQDQTIKHGPGASRFFEEKRHFKKHTPLGPVLMLDKERCIVCARCTRFSDVISGDHALELIERGYKTEVGTPHGKPVHSKFIGNTISICPVGALTSQVYRFRARPWDNKETKTTCSLCPIGCSMILDTRDNQIVRTRSCENHQINDVWLCDKGWFGYQFASHPNRLKTPLIRRKGVFEPSSWDEAFACIAEKMHHAIPSGKIAGLGSPVLTVEENYLFQKLIRDVAQSPHVDYRNLESIRSIQEEGMSAGMETSIEECENLEFILFLGFDITEEFPVLWLRLKKAIQKGAKVFFLGHYKPETARYFEKTILHPPGQEFDVLHTYFRDIANSKNSFHKGAIFVGRQYLDHQERRALLSTIQILSQSATMRMDLNIMEGSGNSMGARFAGAHPELAPYGTSLKKQGLNALQVIETASNGSWDFLYIVGSDYATRCSEKRWNRVRKGLKFLVVQELFMTQTAQEADVVLPALSFLEKQGSFINIEGRVQKLNVCSSASQERLSDQEIFEHIARHLGKPLYMEDAFLHALKSERIPLKRTQIGEKRELVQEKRVLHSEDFLGTYAAQLFDHGNRMQHNAHLSQLIQEPKVSFHPNQAAEKKIQEGEKVSLKIGSATCFARAVLDGGVADNTIVLPLELFRCSQNDLDYPLLNGVKVTVYKEGEHVC